MHFEPHPKGEKDDVILCGRISHGISFLCEAKSIVPIDVCCFQCSLFASFDSLIKKLATKGEWSPTVGLVAHLS